MRLVNVSASRPLSAFKISEIIDIVKTRHVICSTLRTAYRLCKSGDSEGLVLRFRVRIRVTVRVGTRYSCCSGVSAYSFKNVTDFVCFERQ